MPFRPLRVRTTFLSVHKNGQVAIVQTNGNKDCHVILRGGKAPNFDAASVAAACKELEKSKLPATLMVDCSHANSSKQHEKQMDVARDIASQIAGGSHSVFGVMVESHLNAGAQKVHTRQRGCRQTGIRQEHYRCLPGLGRFGGYTGSSVQRDPGAPAALETHIRLCTQAWASSMVVQMRKGRWIKV